MIVAIIQARFNSTRLPGKVLMDIEGKPMLQRVIERVAKSKLIDHIIVALPWREEDYNWLVPLTIKCGVSHYLHRHYSEDDVLGRYYQACPSDARAVVRITSDCPLIDPRVIDRTIQYFLDNDIDYIYNLPPYPDGLDTEVFSYEALVKTYNEVTEPYDREHVTTYIRSHPELFRIGRLEGKGLSLKWSVDTIDDLIFARRVYHILGEEFDFEDILKLEEK